MVGIFCGQTSLVMKFSDRVKEPKLPQRLDQKKIIPSVTETATHAKQAISKSQSLLEHFGAFDSFGSALTCTALCRKI